MADGGGGMVALLGIPPDRRLLAEDLANLPEAEQLREPPVTTMPAATTGSSPQDRS